MSREITNYDTIDTFDQNKHQTVLMGIDNSNYQDIVIINKLYKSDIINELFIDKYKKFSENIVSVTDSDNEFVVINQYEQAALISDFLNENSLDLNERIRLGKSFLYQISDYEDLDESLQLIFIQADQLTIKNGILKFSNYILLKDYQSETKEIDIIREIGKTLEVILQLHKEKLTSDLSSLQQFIYKLLNSDDIPTSYNDLYNNFKIIAATIQEDEICYSPIFEENLNQTVEDNLNQIRISKSVKASISQIPNAEIDDISISYEAVEDTSSDDILDVIDNLEEDDIYLIEDDIELVNKESDEIVETITYDYHELGDDSDLIIESLDENEDIIEDITPSEENIDSAIDQLLKFTETEIVEDTVTIHDSKIDITEKVVDSPDEDLIDPISEIINETVFEKHEEVLPDEKAVREEQNIAAFEEIIEDSIEDSTDFESEPVEENTDVDLEIKTESDLTTFDEDNQLTSDPNTILEEVLLDDIEPEIDVASSGIDTAFEEELTTVEEDIIEMDNQKYYHDEKHHSVVLTNNNSDPIQDILDRNDKQYSDLYVSEKKNKKRFLPTFLLFFIILIVITSLLIYYTSLYT